MCLLCSLNDGSIKLERWLRAGESKECVCFVRKMLFRWKSDADYAREKARNVFVFVRKMMVRWKSNADYRWKKAKNAFILFVKWWFDGNRTLITVGRKQRNFIVVFVKWWFSEIVCWSRTVVRTVCSYFVKWYLDENQILFTNKGVAKQGTLCCWKSG